MNTQTHRNTRVYDDDADDDDDDDDDDDGDDDDDDDDDDDGDGDDDDDDVVAHLVWEKDMATLNRGVFKRRELQP